MVYLYENKKIRYTLTGKGKCLVFLHGFTEDLTIWNKFTSKLDKKFSILCLDLPGHGKSDALDATHSMENQALILKQVLDENKIKKIILTGHSMGGYVSLAFAEAYPSYIKGLCLFHSSATDDTPEVKINRGKTIQIVRQNKFSFLSHFIPDLFAPENRLKYEKFIKKLVEKASRMEPESIIKAIEGMKIRSDKTHVLKSINKPVLFIAGKKDSRIHIEKLLPQIILPSHSESLILENVGHMGYIEDKKNILSTFNNFVNKIYSK